MYIYLIIDATHAHTTLIYNYNDKYHAHPPIINCDHACQLLIIIIHATHWRDSWRTYMIIYICIYIYIDLYIYTHICMYMYVYLRVHTTSLTLRSSSVRWIRSWISFTNSGSVDFTPYLHVCEREKSSVRVCFSRVWIPLTDCGSVSFTP